MLLIAPSDTLAGNNEYCHTAAQLGYTQVAIEKLITSVIYPAKPEPGYYRLDL